MEKRRIFIVNVEEGKVISVLMTIENTCQRWLYKRAPKGMELALDDDIFTKAAMSICSERVTDLDELYCKLRDSDEYYAELVKKVYKKYLKSVLFETSIHQDAFWGD